MKILSWKYPRDRLFFWINKLTQTSRDVILFFLWFGPDQQQRTTQSAYHPSLLMGWGEERKE